MSKLIRKSYKVFLTIWAILQIFTLARAETTETVVEIQLEQGNRARVSGKYGDAGRKNLSFLNSIAGANALGKRIGDVLLTDKDGRPVAFRKLQDGEYFSEVDFTNWSYTIGLDPPENTALAHVSWVDKQFGVLMIDDLLPVRPQKGERVRLSLKVPAGWTVLSTEKRSAADDFEIDVPEDAVFMVGRELQTGSASRMEEGFAVDIGYSGKWHFTLPEALGMAEQILSEYQKVFRGGKFNNVRINILPFPRETQFGTWQAETRGNTVTIVSSDMAFRTQSLQRLHEQLRHELFHIWLPNGVNLVGDHAWFYEGSALYQSLKTGVALNRISFDNFLATLSSAYAIDRRQKQRVSMLETSQNRWAGRNTELYARGILISFMADVALMNASGGKRQIADVFRDIYTRHAFPAAEADANESIIKLMNNHRELRDIIDRYITGGEAIELSSTLAAAGIELAGDRVDSLRVKAKPNSRQKTILDRLGYNNWRKSPKYLK